MLPWGGGGIDVLVSECCELGIIVRSENPNLRLCYSRQSSKKLKYLAPFVYKFNLQLVAGSCAGIACATSFGIGSLTSNNSFNILQKVAER